MARSHARLLAAVWSDQDWLQLSHGSQWCYELLLSQQKLTLVGLLTYTPSRWSRLAADTTLDLIEGFVSELEASRFVLVDRDTDELLVRTLVKHDFAARNLDNRNLLRGLWNAWEAIESRQLRVEAVHAMPDEVFTTDRCQPHPEALQIRRSPRLEPTVPTTDSDQPSEPSVGTSGPNIVPRSSFPDVDPSAAYQSYTTTRLSDAERRQRLEQAVDVLVDRHMAKTDSTHNPVRHRAAVRNGKLKDHAARAHSLLTEHPDLDTEALADLLEPPRPAASTAVGQPATVYDEQQRVQRQRETESMRKHREALDVEPASEEHAKAALAAARKQTLQPHGPEAS